MALLCHFCYSHISLKEHLSAIPVLLWVRVTQSLIFKCFLYCLFFWLLYYLCFFDLQLLITPFGIFKLLLTRSGKLETAFTKRIALSISNRIYLQNTNYLLQDVHLYSEGLCWPYQYHLQTFWWMYESSSNKSLW